MTGQAELRRPRGLMTGCLTIVALLSACLAMTAATAQDRVPDYAAIIAAPDRTEADLQISEADVSSLWRGLVVGAPLLFHSPPCGAATTSQSGKGSVFTVRLPGGTAP
jgi:hypothetical protein